MKAALLENSARYPRLLFDGLTRFGAARENKNVFTRTAPPL